MLDDQVTDLGPFIIVDKSNKYVTVNFKLNNIIQSFNSQK